MANQFNIPVPVQNGTSGAAVDVSALGPILTVLCFQQNPGGALRLEQSWQNAGDWSPVSVFPEVPQTQVLEVEANFVRLTRVAGTGVAGQNFQAADQSGNANPPGTVGPLAVPATGAGAAGDISGEPPNLLAFFAGATASDQVLVEHSFDGANWAPLGNAFSGVALAVVSGANQARGNRQVSGLAAGTLTLYGAPK